MLSLECEMAMKEVEVVLFIYLFIFFDKLVLFIFSWAYRE